MKKNTAGQKITVFAFNTTTALPVTADAANITADVSLDDSTPVSVIDVNPTEISGGYYSFDVTQAETNADKLHIIAASTSSNVVVIGDPSSVIYTTTTAAGAGGDSAGLESDPVERLARHRRGGVGKLRRGRGLHQRRMRAL